MAKQKKRKQPVPVTNSNPCAYAKADSPFSQEQLERYFRIFVVHAQDRRWWHMRELVNEMEAEATAQQEGITDDTYVCAVPGLNLKIAGYLAEEGIETVGQLKRALKREGFRARGIGEVLIRELKTAIHFEEELLD